MTYTLKDGWVCDEDNNRASVNYWGSEKAAQDSLATLSRCPLDVFA